MKREIRDFVSEGIVRVTIADERWYFRENKDKTRTEVPSVTWIAGCYPKGVQFYKWLAQKGWDESEAIKTSAGDKGSKVHNAIEDLLKGDTVKMDSKYINNSTGQPEELTIDEYSCLMNFVDWHNETKPKTLRTEFVIFDDIDGYAGTVDYLCQIGDEVWLIDFKTGQSVWTEYELQISAYRKALERQGVKIDKMATLQVGYKLNKRGWKLTELEDKYPLFLHAKAIWQEEHGGEKPKIVNYPDKLKVGNPEIKK